jgi:hypothetical protein
MIALKGEEWAMLLFIGLVIIGILYARANRKQKTQKLRYKIVKDIYSKAIDAQQNSIQGIGASVKMGTGIHERTTPMDLQDPTRLYVRSTLAEMNQAKRDYLLENEYLNIDESTRTH